MTARRVCRRLRSQPTGEPWGRRNPELLARIRAHGNFGEYVPFVLILMGLIELAGGNRTVLTWSGIALVVFRVPQAIGIWKRVAPQPLRIAGTAGTLVLLVYYSSWAIGACFGSWATSDAR